jgi:hypothetical protein
MRSGEYPEEALRPFRRIALKYLAGVWISLLLTLGVSLLTWSTELAPKGQDASLWFQRGGSITTIGALIIGIFAGRLRDSLRGKFLGDIYGIYVFKEVKTSFTISTVASFSLTVAGTLVWGYGDILHAWWHAP